jgi:ABC-2 type transport system ATP-binding protein
MTEPLQTVDLGKRYRTGWALRDCTLAVPRGSVTALIGPNGAGKTTLLRLAVGLATPSSGSVSVFGRDPRADAAAVLPSVGFVGQERPLYPRLTVEETCALGTRLNRRWDRVFATARLDQLGIDRRQKAGKLSAGQQAQLAVVLALAKRPELILLDEPTAGFDPLAKRELLQLLMDAVATDGTTVVLASHSVPDVERISDRLVILSRATVLLAEEIETFLGTHRLLVGPRASTDELERVGNVVHASNTDRQSTLLVRANGHPYDARWDVRQVGFEELVLGYLSQTEATRNVPAERLAI